MAYQALYRQWRTKRFGEIVGQEPIVRTLRQQVISGHIAHAYLFSGTRGTGKTSTAQVFSRAINCLDPQEGEPCGVCQNCVSLAEGTSLDVEEIDAASNNGVDEIRSLRDRIVYPPQNARYRVYIIDEVHMLSTGAFNALLKTLEEPPPHAVMILATTEPQRLPATIISRCQRFDFKRIPAREIAGRLQEAADREGAAAEEGALLALARAADGSMRDGFSLLDMCLSLSERVTMETVEAALGSAGEAFLSKCIQAMAASDAAGMLQLIDTAARDGRDMAVLARELCQNLRSAMVAHMLGETAADVLEVSQEQCAAYAAMGAALGEERTLRAIDLFARAEPDMRWASQPRVLLELAAVSACRPEDHQDLAAMRQRIEQLEKRLESGALPAQPIEAAATPAQTPPPSAASAAVPQAQAPAAQAAPAAPSGAKAAVNPNAGALWKAALQALRKGLKMTQYSALTKARLQNLVEDTAFVAFDPQDDVFYQMMQAEKNAEVLEQALTEAAGRSMKVRFLLAGQAEAAAPEPPPAQQSSWLEDAVDFFGRENIDVVEKGDQNR